MRSFGLLISLSIGILTINASSQEYIYPNILYTDQGTLEYRGYTIQEARQIENHNSVNPDTSLIADWGQERLIIPDEDYIYCTDLAVFNNSIYCVYSDIQSPRIGFTKSTDAGISWSDSTDLSDTTIVLFNRFPDIICNGNDLIMGFRGQESGQENLFYRRSSDEGETWGVMERVFPYWQGVSNYASLCNSGINLYFAYINYDHDSLYVVRSTNWGDSWNNTGRNIAYLQSTLQPIRIASSGNYVHFVWANLQRPFSIRYSRSTNRGLAWSSEIDISNDSSGAQFPHISVDGSHIVVSWMGYKYSPFAFTGDIFIKQSFDNGASWDSSQVLTTLHTAGDGSIYCKDSIIVALWEDFRFEGNNDEEMALISTNRGSSWGEEIRLSYGENDSYPAVAVSIGNTIHALWGDLKPEAPGLYYCRNDLISGIEEDTPNLPNATRLFAYPNPFNSATTIKLTGAEQAEIGIYDITGRKITSLPASQGRAIWDASGVSSGLYFARVAGEKRGTIKLILVK